MDIKINVFCIDSFKLVKKMGDNKLLTNKSTIYNIMQYKLQVIFYMHYYLLSTYLY